MINCADFGLNFWGLGYPCSSAWLIVNMSIWAACRVAKLHHKQFITWKRDIVRMQEKRNKKAKSMCLGQSSVLHAFEDQLLCYIFELREQGMAVLSRLVIIKASS